MGSVNQDPRAALNNAKNLVEGKGFMGWVTKTFMGKSFASDMKATIAQGEEALNSLDVQRRLLASGSPGKATVANLQDTGSLINNNPVVQITLHVTPEHGTSFDTTVTIPISKIAIPRKGDTVLVKFNPQNHAEVAIVG